MKKILVTGGTTFVSKYAAKWAMKYMYLTEIPSHKFGE